MAREPVRPADLSSLVELRSVRLSDDGRLLAAVATRLDQDSNRIERTLVTGFVDAGPLREGPPPEGRVSEELPRWEPAANGSTGRRLAAIRSDDARSRLVLRQIDDDGALLQDEEVELAQWHDPVTELCWSPDGQWLLAVVLEQRYRTIADLPADRRPPLRLTRLRYRYDGLGLTVNRPHRVPRVGLGRAPA